MNIYRIALMGLLIFSTFCLTGFKKPLKKSHLIHKEVDTQPKTLNLDIPLKNTVIASGRSDGEADQPSVKTGTSALFESGKPQKNQPLGLRGQVILSQEPEAGKIKSADGAGIVLDFHP